MDSVFKIFLGNLMSAIVFWGIALLLGWLAPKIFGNRLKSWIMQLVKEAMEDASTATRGRKGRGN